MKTRYFDVHSYCAWKIKIAQTGQTEQSGALHLPGDFRSCASLLWHFISITPCFAQCIFPQVFFIVDGKLAVSTRKARIGKNNMAALNFISRLNIVKNCQDDFHFPLIFDKRLGGPLVWSVVYGEWMLMLIQEQTKGSSTCRSNLLVCLVKT